jgi:hypothetical protein
VPLLGLFLVPSLTAKPPQPEDAEAVRWFAAVNRQRLRTSWHLTLAMTLRNDRGFRRDLELDARWAAWKDTAAALVVVREPASVRGTAMLSREEIRSGAEHRSWVFLNTRSPLVVEVPGNSRAEGLLGSDFSHADQQRLLDTAEWKLSSLGETACGTSRCVRIEGVRRRAKRGPLDPDRAVWWIDKSRKEVVRAQQFAADRPLKTLEVTEWAAAEGVWIPRRQTMRTLETGSETVLTLIRFERVTTFPEADFRPENLPEQARRTAGKSR